MTQDFANNRSLLVPKTPTLFQEFLLLFLTDPERSEGIGPGEAPDKLRAMDDFRYANKEAPFYARPGRGDNSSNMATLPPKF
jgi:hypothetical protein